MRSKLVPNHLVPFQIMKKKNTGVKEVIQGHRAKMNSSDRSGLDQEDADGSGWTEVVSKRSRRMLRKNQKVEESPKSPSSSSKALKKTRSRSRSASGGAAQGQEGAADEVRENGVGGDHKSERSDSKPTKKSGSRSRSASRTASPVQDDAAGEIRNDAAHADAAATGCGSEKSKKGKRARSPSDQRKSKVDAADDLTLEELMQDLVKNGERVKPRDVDPGKQMPDPFVVRSVARGAQRSK